MQVRTNPRNLGFRLDDIEIGLARREISDAKRLGLLLEKHWTAHALGQRTQMQEAEDAINKLIEAHPEYYELISGMEMHVHLAESLRAPSQTRR